MGCDSDEKDEDEKIDEDDEECEYDCPIQKFFEDCPIKRWMGCTSEESGNSSGNSSCNWGSCGDWSACPLTECGIPAMAFLIPFLLLVVGFCPLVWLGIIGCLVFRFTRNSSAFHGFPVKMGLRIGCLLLVPCLFRCCTLIWGLILGVSIFMMKKRHLFFFE